MLAAAVDPSPAASPAPMPVEEPFAHGYAAMAREDIADAKRRRADRSLEPYAAARGLEYLGRAKAAGFAPALPTFVEEQQQLMRGTLPGGRGGILLHALLQTHFNESSGSSNMPGSFYGVVVKGPKGSFKKALKPNRTWIPVIGSWLDSGIDESDKAFGTTGAWSPTTVCAVRVPETIAMLPELHLRTRSRTAGFRGRDVGQLRLERGTGKALEAVLAIPRLANLIGPYWDVRVEYGVLTVTRNGFAVEDADLDALCQLTCALADAIATACAVPPAPALTTVLPPADPTTDRHITGDWAKDIVTTAAARGFTLEDPEAWHQTFGSLPTPGRALAVLRKGDTRVLLCLDQPMHKTRSVRPVLVSEASLQTTTAPAGVGLPGARVFIENGVETVWSLTTLGYVGDALDHAQQLAWSLTTMELPS